jgi:hypothetical protein
MLVSHEWFDLGLKENKLSPSLAPFIEPLQIVSRHVASPIEQVTGSEPPSLTIHGSNGWCVPKINPLALYNRLKTKGSKTKLVIVKNHMHANVFDDYYKTNSKPAILVERFLVIYLPTPENH